MRRYLTLLYDVAVANFIKAQLGYTKQSHTEPYSTAGEMNKESLTVECTDKDGGVLSDAL